MTTEAELAQRAGSLEASIREATQVAASTNGKAQEAVPILASERTELEQLRSEKANAAHKAELDATIKEAVKAALLDMRSPSLAAQAGGGPAITEAAQARFQMDASPALKASLGANYEAGTLLTGLIELGSLQGDKAAGKAVMQKLGLAYLEVPADTAKATLGTTGATGGYVLPNNLVAQVEKPNTQVAVYTGPNPLVTVISGVAVRGVDQPYRTGSPSRMTAQDWGETKENVNEAYGSYTATLTTFARIYDIGKQYARFSAGAAEADVIDELTRAAALTENFAVIAGPGTGSATPGVNDATKGVYTSLLGNVYTTAHTASASTIAGSAAAGLIAGFGALSGRSRYPSAAVLDDVSYWSLFSQGSDTAGFWMSDMLGAGFNIGPDNALRWRGVPIYYDANLTANSAANIAIVGDWKALKFYRGLEFRIDSSDVAGDRWDKNLIGFRGEMEIAVNADTAVAVGAFQLITGIVP